MKHFTKSLMASAIGLLCATAAEAQVVFQNHSKTPNLVKINAAAFPTADAYSLIGSQDTLVGSPSFRFGGSADGSGLLKNSNGTYFIILNHEDNFSVSRIMLDAFFTPVTGEYILNSNAGFWRLCSSTMATPEEHGFGPLYITCGETSAESMTHALNPLGSPIKDSLTSALTTLTGFGRWNAENAVPLPKTAYPGKTVVLIGDDDSGPDGGQVAMYVSSTGDLSNGKVYVLRRVDLNQRERDIPTGSTVNVEFVEVPTHQALTGAQINAMANGTLKSIKFNRVEDLDYRKGSPEAGREIYFNATGQVNADTVDRTLWGRVYRLKLDAKNPLKGTLECIMNGDDKSTSNPARTLQQPDNICVTEDYVYVQEDPNGYTFPDALPYVHDARLYQYDIETKAVTEVMELDHHRHANDSDIYNRNSAGTNYANSATGGWEYGAMIDISDQTGVPNSFLLSLQPHSWRYPEFTNPDGGTLRTTENQGSLLITLTNIPRVKVKAPISNGTNICSGEKAMLKAIGGTTYYLTNGTTYKWYATSGAATPLFTGSSFETPVLTASATYYVATLNNGMESLRTPVTVNVNARPAVPAASAASGCGEVILDAGVNNASYLWSNGATTKTTMVSQSGTYTVTVTSNGCSAGTSFQATVNPIPATPSITVSSTGTVLTSSYSAGNKWFRDGNQISTNRTITVTENGTYTLTYTNDKNCTSAPASIQYQTLSVDDVFSDNSLKVYPNPNTGLFTVKYENNQAKSLQVSVLNLTGQVIYSEKADDYNGSYETQVDLNKQPAGTYIVQLVTNQGIVQKKLIKQ